MTDYRNTSSATWAQNIEKIRGTFDRWGIGFEHFNIECEHADTYSKNNRAGWVKVAYRHPATGRMVVMQKDDQYTARQNLNAIATTLEDLRMQERRGLSDLVQQHYLALPAPATERDPYEALGVRPDTDLDDIEGMYRIRAKRLHPDAPGGGNPEEMKALNAAIEAVRRARSG